MTRDEAIELLEEIAPTATCQLPPALRRPVPCAKLDEAEPPKSAFTRLDELAGKRRARRR